MYYLFCFVSRSRMGDKNTEDPSTMRYIRIARELGSSGNLLKFTRSYSFIVLFVSFIFLSHSFPCFEILIALPLSTALCLFRFHGRNIGELTSGVRKIEIERDRERNTFAFNFSMYNFNMLNVSDWLRNIPK